jgi:hypothetical protein
MIKFQLLAFKVISLDVHGHSENDLIGSLKNYLLRTHRRFATPLLTLPCHKTSKGRFIRSNYFRGVGSGFGRPS